MLQDCHGVRPVSFLLSSEFVGLLSSLSSPKKNNGNNKTIYNYRRLEKIPFSDFTSSFSLSSVSLPSLFSSRGRFLPL